MINQSKKDLKSLNDTIDTLYDAMYTNNYIKNQTILQKIIDEEMTQLNNKDNTTAKTKEITQNKDTEKDKSINK